MPIAKSLEVGQHGYVQLDQLWLTDSRTALYVTPQFYFVGENRPTTHDLPLVKHTQKGFILAVPKHGKIQVTKTFPRALAPHVRLIPILGLFVPGQDFRPAIVFYFAKER